MEKDSIFETEIAAAVGPRITELRTAKNLSVNKLANLTGVSQSYLRDVELGKKNPTINFLALICSTLRISLRDFFDIKNSDSDEKKENELLHSKIDTLSREQKSCLLQFLNSIS